MIQFRYLQPEDAVAAAEIHIEGQPGSVLTLLGPRFLAELYRAVCTSEWGEGIGAFDNGKLVAQTAMAVSSEKFFAEFKQRHLWRVVIPVMMSIMRHPQIIRHVMEGWSYAEQTHSPESEGDVIFLGVKRDYARQGLAPDLVHYMFGWANSIGLTSANFMIEKRNRPIRWMISQLNNLYIAHEFEAYGREMLFYKVPIKNNITLAKLPQGHPYTPAHVYPPNFAPPLPSLHEPSRQARLAAGILSLIFALLSSLHLYWVFGGTWGIKQAIPTQATAKPLFTPSKAMTFSVATALISAALIVLGRIGMWGKTIPKGLFRVGMWGISAVFLGRAVGDFKWMGFFKQMRQSEFAYWDSRLFSPLSLLIAWLAFMANRD